MIRRINTLLNEHDTLDANVRHQAMVLCQSIGRRNSATHFVDNYNAIFAGHCAAYHTESDDTKEQFCRGRIRVLAIVGRLLEGFDRSQVSVLGIFRNVAASSRVLFSQFVGR